jgi:hypothetical protein
VSPKKQQRRLPKNVNEVEIDDLTDFIKVVTELLTKKPFSSKSPLWFRGHSSHTHALVPSIYRKQYDEISLINEYLIYASSFIKREVLDGWDWIANMQHYGLPTRLLDWSESYLVALYFSLLGNSDDFPSIWIMSPDELNKQSTGAKTTILASGDKLFKWLPKNLRFHHIKAEDAKEKKTTGNGKTPVAIYIRHTNSRIIAQSGAFTLHGEFSKSLEDYFIAQKLKCVRKIILKPGQGYASVKEFRESMLYQLELAGVHELFLPSVAKHLLQRRIT